jgi:lipoprotein-releasing system permease protein
MTRLPFELFLGLRYLKPKRTFVSVITLISLIGVILGVWVLIVVIAVMSGFDRELRDKLMGMHPHVTVSGRIIEHGDKLVSALKTVPGVKEASPFLLGPVLIEFNHQAATPYMKGIDPKHDVMLGKLREYIRQGALDLNGNKVVIGEELADSLGIYLGDKITVYSPRNLEKKGDEVYLPMELTVAGIFQSGMYEYDIGLIFTSLDTAQELYDMGNSIHGVELMTTDPINGANALAARLQPMLPPGLRAQTWAQMNGRLLGAIHVEKTVMFTILIFIIVVAAFGITSTLITVTVQKTRDIGVMKSLGATPGRIMRIFLLQGLVVGVFGVIIGVGMGLLTVANINPIQHFLANVLGVELFPRDIYNFSEIPAYLTIRDLLTISFSALGICTLAGLIPALRAARLEPVEALRYE